jgi:hypothetical protein
VTVKLAAKLADDKKDLNGLTAILDDILANHTGRWVVAAIVEPVRITDEVAKGGLKIPTVGVVHIEAMLGDNTAVVRELIEKTYQARTGRTPLPFDEHDDQAAEHSDARRVAGEAADPFYGGPIKDGDTGPDLLADPDSDGPVAERPRDEWLDKG